jgi:hypothetical protein
MNTDGDAKASICKEASQYWIINACVPCYHAGTAILQIVALCTKDAKVEGKMM